MGQIKDKVYRIASVALYHIPTLTVHVINVKEELFRVQLSIGTGRALLMISMLNVVVIVKMVMMVVAMMALVITALVIVVGWG